MDFPTSICQVKIYQFKCVSVCCWSNFWVHPKKSNDVIIYSPSCRSKPIKQNFGYSSKHKWRCFQWNLRGFCTFIESSGNQHLEEMSIMGLKW